MVAWRICLVGVVLQSEDRLWVNHDVFYFVATVIATLKQLF